MTAYFASIRLDILRKAIWLIWFPLGVYPDLWWRFRNSPRFEGMVWACWDLGWEGVK